MINENKHLANKNLIMIVILSLISSFLTIIGAVSEIEFFSNIISYLFFILRILSFNSLFINLEFLASIIIMICLLNIVIAIVARFFYFSENMKKFKIYKILSIINFIIDLFLIISLGFPVLMYIFFINIMPSVIMLFLDMVFTFFLIILIKYTYDILKELLKLNKGGNIYET